MDEVVKRGRGRPPGSRNKSKPGDAVREINLAPDSMKPARGVKADYDHPDPDTMIGRQLSMVNWAQKAVRNEMRERMELLGKNVVFSAKDMDRLETLSNTLVRTIDGLKKSSDLAEELSKRMSPQDLLEAAIKKIEAQDIQVLNYAIKRLRAHRERLGPIPNFDRPSLGPDETATDAIASLGK